MVWVHTELLVDQPIHIMNRLVDFVLLDMSHRCNATFRNDFHIPHGYFTRNIDDIAIFGIFEVTIFEMNLIKNSVIKGYDKHHSGAVITLDSADIDIADDGHKLAIWSLCVK
ncbi:MAG: hypothetical protein CENE_02497 [Candidatus Celerinatantimonas neptuna]|nr:MAG: hypothetical protein CENE_02497 [Candidatus Celerinatantimonas neptuna]